MKLRPATASDVLAFYGKPLAQTCQAHVVEHDGEVLGIGGVAYMECGLVAFSKIKPTISRKLLLRGAKLYAEKFAAMDAPIFATPDPDHPTAPAFLRHLGFAEWAPGIYRYEQ